MQIQGVYLSILGKQFLTWEKWNQIFYSWGLASNPKEVYSLLRCEATSPLPDLCPHTSQSWAVSHDKGVAGLVGTTDSHRLSSPALQISCLFGGVRNDCPVRSASGHFFPHGCPPPPSPMLDLLFLYLPHCLRIQSQRSSFVPFSCQCTEKHGPPLEGGPGLGTWITYRQPPRLKS